MAIRPFSEAEPLFSYSGPQIPSTRRDAMVAIRERSRKRNPPSATPKRPTPLPVPDDWYIDGKQVIKEILVESLPGRPFKVSRLHLDDGTSVFRCRWLVDGELCGYVSVDRGGIARHRNADHGANIGRNKPKLPAPVEQEPLSSPEEQLPQPPVVPVDIFVPPAAPEPEATVEPPPAPPAAEPIPEAPAVEVVDEPVESDVEVLDEPVGSDVDLVEPADIGFPRVPVADSRSTLEMTLGELLAVAPSIKALSDLVNRAQEERDEALRELRALRAYLKSHNSKIQAYDNMQDELIELRYRLRTVMPKADKLEKAVAEAQELRAWKKKFQQRLKSMGFVLTEEENNGH